MLILISIALVVRKFLLTKNYCIMKNLFLLSFVLVSLFFGTSCEKLDEEFTQFTIDYNTSVVIENGSIINLPINLLTPEIETNQESEFSVNNTRKDLVEEVMLQKLQLKVTSPDNQSLDFINKIKLYINAEGLSELEIAFKDPVPNDVGDELLLDVNDNNLREYIIKDKFSLRVEVVSDQIMGQDVYIDVFSTFFIDAKLI